MARKRKKAKNPATPWLKYALVAVGGYLIFRFLKNRGILGGNGDDEYVPYVPAPVVEKVSSIVAKPPASMGSRIVPLQQLKKKYDITYERYKAAPAQTAQAQAAYNAAQARMDLAKSEAVRLRDLAQAQAKSNPVQARATNVAAVKKEMEASQIKEVQIPVLKADVRAKQGLEKLPADELRKLEDQLAKSVQEVDDFMQAAILATSGSQVATEP